MGIKVNEGEQKQRKERDEGGSKIRREEGKQSELTFQMWISSNIGDSPEQSVEFPHQTRFEHRFISLE